MASTDDAPARSSHFGWIRDTVNHQWKGMLVVWLFGTIAAGVLVYQNMTPTYRAASLIRVDPAVTDLYGVKPDGDSLEAFLATQVQLITSPNILTAAGTLPKAAALERIQKADDVVQELKKAIQVGVIPGTYLIEVSMTSPNPQEAATLVNAVVNSFMDANGEWSNGMTRIQIKNLDAYSIDLRNQTDELERRWKTLVAKGDIGAADVDRKNEARRADLSLEEFRVVYRDLKNIELELTEGQAWLETAKMSVSKAGEVARPEAEQVLIENQVDRKFRMDPEVQSLAAQMAEARGKADQARRARAQEGDPAVRAATDRVEGLKSRYQKLWETKSIAFRKAIEAGGKDREGRFDPAKEVQEAEANVDRLKVRQAVLKDQYWKVAMRNEKNATDIVEVQIIMDERASLKEMQEAVTRRLEQLKFEAKGEARIRVVSPNGALAPGRPIRDRRPMFLGLIPLAMMFVTFALFVGIEADSKAR